MKEVNQIASWDNYIKWIKDRSVHINQNSEADNLTTRISVLDKQNLNLLRRMK